MECRKNARKKILESLAESGFHANCTRNKSSPLRIIARSTKFPTKTMTNTKKKSEKRKTVRDAWHLIWAQMRRPRRRTFPNFEPQMTRCRHTHCVVSTYAAVIFHFAIVMETSGSKLGICSCVMRVWHMAFIQFLAIFNLPTSIFS